MGCRSRSGPREDVGNTTERGVMSVEAEPGSDTVTARTRAFEEIDAQVFAGPGRGATRSEAAASDRWGEPSPATVEAYRRMFDLVVKHQLAPGGGRPPTTPNARIGRRATILAGRSTKPRSSTGVDVPSAAPTGLARRLSVRHPLSNTPSEPVQPRSRAVSHQNETATEEDRRV
jgi:hypothetical protein